MRRLFARGQGRSLGERRIILGCLITGVFGALLALIVVLRLDPQAMFQRPLSLYERWILLSGAMGGAAGVMLSRHRLGRDGLADPVMGVAIMTFSAAIVGGTLALPFYGTMFGPFTVAIIFVASPLVFALWLANAIAVHFMVRSWHAERNSIFGVAAPKPMISSVRDWCARLLQRRLNP